jgi:hypothetical protein
MGARKAFFPILLLLMVGAYVVGRGYEGSRGTLGAEWSPELEGLLRRQKAERKIEPVELQASLELKNSPDTPFYGPLRVEAGATGEIHVLDSGDLKVKSFSPEGRPLRSFGRGKGQGPGELLSATDFGLAADGALWVTDLLNGRLSIFRPDGGEATRKLEVQPYRLALQDDGSFFLMFGLAHDRLFGHFDREGKELRRFGGWLQNQGLNAMLLDGWIEPLPDGGFAYVGRYSGLLAAFDAQGEPRFVTETVDGAGLPRILQGDGGRHWVDREAEETARALSVCRGELIVFTAIESGLERRGVLDRYALATGSYLGTWRVPGPAVSALCTDQSLYTVRDTAITRWPLPPLGAP